MKKRLLLLILIFCISFILRFYKLGDNPPSLDWDEASLGYNAYSIIHTLRDEYGEFLPISIKSFGDYKPPFYTYLSIIPIIGLGLNEYSVRFVSAFLGSVTVVICYALFFELSHRRKIKQALLFSFFAAVNPWMLQFSRIAFEANVGLFFYYLGFLLLSKSVNNRNYLIPSMIFFVMSIYSYHSPRLIVPLTITAFILLNWKSLGKYFKHLAISLIIFGLFTYPLVFQGSSGAKARFSSVSVLNSSDSLNESIFFMESDREKSLGLLAHFHNRRVVWVKEIIGGYLDHFNIDFLFIKGDPPGRHHAAGMGMMYQIELVFIGAGIYIIYKKRKDFRLDKIMLLVVLTPAASALTTGTPHAVRALLFSVPLIFISSLGFHYLSVLTRKPVKIFFFTVFIFNIFYYLHMYYIHTPREYAQDWQFGYKEAVLTVKEIEDRYRRIITTYRYDQPYVYYLFYFPFKPETYHNLIIDKGFQRAERSFGKYEFRNISFEEDRKIPQALLVGTPDEIPEGYPGIIKSVYFPDGRVAFRIAETGY